MTIIKAKVPSIKQEGGSLNEAEVATSQDSEEPWEDVSEGGPGGSGHGGVIVS